MAVAPRPLVGALSERPQTVHPGPVVDQRFFECAARIEHDLRTRFPEITVRMVRDPDGDWECEVRDGNDYWGSVGSWDDDDSVPSAEEVEEFTESLALNVADNLWPDELTDPWPLCSLHGDHPLQPCLVARRAVWQCWRDEKFGIRVGDLPPT